MKKILSFALLLCSFAALNAQIAFQYAGHDYQNGDTLTVILDKDDAHCTDINIKNQTGSVMSNLVVTMEEIENHGIECWGICVADQCVPVLTSNPFTLTPNAVDESFTVDLNIDDVEKPYSIYTLSCANAMVSTTVVVRFQAYEETLGINTVAASSVNVYPNPAQGQVNFSYNVDQPSTLSIIDMQGRVVSQFSVQGQGTTSISNLPAGIYVYGFAGQKMNKLIIK